MLELPRQIPKRVALLALSAFFVAAGVGHFVAADFFVSIMPPYLPAHLELVCLSGVFEIAGGIGVLIPRFRVLAGRGLILLLLAVFPANLHMALHPELFPEMQGSALYARLPLQLVFIVWAYWATRDEPGAGAGAG
jgi:uncharacterized membrane protein